MCGHLDGLELHPLFHEQRLHRLAFSAARLNIKTGVYLAGGTWLDIGGTDVLGPPLQAEVVGRVSVLLAGQIELKILLAELRAQECSKHRNSS